MTDAERERLIKLSEECSEVIQMINKTLLWGYESEHPDTKESNRNRLSDELAQIQYWVIVMYLNEDIDYDYVDSLTFANHEKAMKWSKHQDKEMLDNVFDNKLTWDNKGATVH